MMFVGIVVFVSLWFAFVVGALFAIVVIRSMKQDLGDKKIDPEISARARVSQSLSGGFDTDSVDFVESNSDI